MKLGFDQQMFRRRLIIVIAALVCLLVPTPFVINYLNGLQATPMKNFTGIPVTWRSLNMIKVKHKRLTSIPIRYTHTSRIAVQYKDLSAIKITYRNGADSLAEDARFPIVRLRNTVFRVMPRQVN